MVTVSIIGMILTVCVSGASFAFGIVQTIRLNNEQQKTTMGFVRLLKEYGMYEVFRQKQDESIRTVCGQSDLQSD